MNQIKRAIYVMALFFFYQFLLISSFIFLRCFSFIFFIIYVILSLDFALVNNTISIITNLACIYDRGDKDEQSFIKVKRGSLSR